MGKADRQEGSAMTRTTTMAGLTSEPGSTVTEEEIHMFLPQVNCCDPGTDPGSLQYLFGETKPEPHWEEFTYTFNATLGAKEARMGSSEFATLGMPEPAMMGSPGPGLAGSSTLHRCRKH